MSPQEVEKAAEGGNLITQEDLDALLAQQEEEFGEISLTTPILKIGEQLTREVQEGNAEAGDFIDTLTGESLGDKVEFVIAYYQQGRIAHDKKTKRTFVAFTQEIPEAWADLVGEEFVGTPFSEYPDAEETFKREVNAGNREWGSGPLISTTHNFTGLVLVPVLDAEGNETGEVETRPVRISLKRTNVPSVRKILTLKKASLRNRPFWDKVFEFTTTKKDFSSGSAHLLQSSLGRETTAEEKAAAVELAQAVAAGRVADNSATAEAPAGEPDAAGGLSV